MGDGGSLSDELEKVWTQQILTSLGLSGVPDGAFVDLGFKFEARDKRCALNFIGSMSTSDVASLERRGGAFRRKWFVTGTTRDIVVDYETLRQWLRRIVSLGWEHRCVLLIEEMTFGRAQ